jgi:SAF domain-containing protein
MARRFPPVGDRVVPECVRSEPAFRVVHKGFPPFPGDAGIRHYVPVTIPSPAPAPSSPRPRRIATPSWLDARLVLGVVLVLASVLIGAKIVSGAGHTYATVAARRDLAAGTILTSDDVKLAQVQLPDRGNGVYLSRLHDAVGKQLGRPVAAGELVPADAVASTAAQTTITVPLEASAAPDLRKGERIELWVSTGACSSTVLLPDVTVQAVRADAGGSFGTGTGGQDVVVSVAPPLADRVVQALALDGAKLRAGVLVGSRPASGASGGSPLPDLAPCSSPTASR